MVGVSEVKSNKAMSDSLCSSMSEDKPSKMSVAELQSYEHNGMVIGQKCDLVGWSE